MSSRFPVVKVSKEVDRLIEAVAQAAITLGAVSIPEDPKDEVFQAAVEDAYANLSMARKALYEHVEILETRSRYTITRDVTRRFD